MGMIETNHGDSKRLAGHNRFPGDLVRVTRFDDMRFLLCQDFFDRIQVKQSAITRRSGDKWRTDQKRFAFGRFDPFGFFSGHNQQVLVPERIRVFAFLLYVTLHPSAERGIKLGEIADLQWRIGGSR
jgi:hypothetical protein